MTIKEYLNRPYFIKKKINYLECELERYQVMMNSIPQPRYESERVTTSPSKETPNQKALEKYYETLGKLDDEYKRLEQVVEKITNAIEPIKNDNYKLMLKYRYIDNMPLVEIAEKMFIAYITAKKWHSNALKEIVIPEKYIP